ncbi:hypothetical protein BpHYR1_032702 [Brachionus plicatilis]|uniref:Uncharacterized protein n=1 Tax=Brachionus plicatilis TaxID=10195 RepID=A0A3M7Q3C2_BRAPC|nr:hypothetical protein BpHYR1_032702 [Brachionus plicatilis]
MAKFKSSHQSLRVSRASMRRSSVSSSFSDTLMHFLISSTGLIEIESIASESHFLRSGLISRSSFSPVFASSVKIGEKSLFSMFHNKRIYISQKQISRSYKLEKLFIRYLKNCFGHKNDLITSLSKEYFCN